MQNLFQRMHIAVGPIHTIKNVLTECVQKLPAKKKFCVLIWDEISLKAHLDYDSCRKEIIGFQNYGFYKTRDFADRSCVSVPFTRNE